MEYNLYCQVVDNIILGTPIVIPMQASSVELPEKLDYSSYQKHFKKYPEDYRRLISKLSFMQRDKSKAKEAETISKKLRAFREANPELKEASKAKTSKELMVRDIKAVKKELSNTLKQVAENTGVSGKRLAEAFKQKNTFEVVKAFGFSIKKMSESISATTALIKKPLQKVSQRLADTKVMRKLQKGTLKVDKFLDKYPVLKKMTGPAVAGVMLYGWLNMQFCSDFEYDMDLSSMGDALAGNFSLHDTFVGEDGVMFMGLLAGGMMGGPSFPWLGKTGLNMATAVSYTAMKKLNVDKEKLKGLLKKIPLNKPVNKKTFKELKGIITDIAKGKAKLKKKDVVASLIKSNILNSIKKNL
jgi:hypothetical protein